MLILPVRATILYLLVVLVIRIMGKHQIGQLQPYELVITIMISELAAVPMQDTDIPLINGIIPILTLLFIQLSLSMISLKNDRFRRLISGGPSLLIERGLINQAELLRLRYNLTDLLEQLRLKGFPNITDVEYAILETSGKLSVIPKSGKRPANPEDLKLNPPYDGLPAILIEDGRIKTENLQKFKLSEEWLAQELTKAGIQNAAHVLLASRDASGKMFIQAKKNAKENPAS